MMDFGEFMRALSKTENRKVGPIEPCIDHGAKHFAKRKEQADLEDGAVLKALHREGLAQGSTPEEGDLVKFHYTIRRESSAEVIETTQTKREDQNSKGEVSSSDSPVIFVLGKGCRMPRGLEIALQSMKKGEISTFTIKPNFAFKHPGSAWHLKDPSLEGEVLNFDVELVDITGGVSAQVVNHYDDDAAAAAAASGGQKDNEDAIRRNKKRQLDEMVIKEIMKDGTGWENPRPPYRVKVHVCARVGLSGAVFFQTSANEPLVFSCGENSVPHMLEEAISLMFKGEVAKIYVRKSLEQSPLIPTATAGGESGLLHVYEVSLVDVIQVRDVIGTKEIMKCRIKNGEGEFPIDCPIVDCCMKIHCLGRLKETGAVFWDTRKNKKDPDSDSDPFSFETGLNVTPDGLEMCLKLMVPGETSLIQCASKYAYDTLKEDDAIGSHVPKNSDVEWEVTLVGFEKPRPLATLTLEESVVEAGKRKTKANALFNSARYKYAQEKYEQLLKELNSVVETGLEDPEDKESEFSQMETLVLSCMLNLAACAQKLGDYPVALKHCNKVLEASPENTKALYRRGQTLASLSEWEAARRDYKSMASINEELKSEAEAALVKLDRLEAVAIQQQKKQFKGFFNR
jgi:FKBP-type peptidyl-prolyl cis-trans isomerase